MFLILYWPLKVYTCVCINMNNAFQIFVCSLSEQCPIYIIKKGKPTWLPVSLAWQELSLTCKLESNYGYLSNSLIVQVCALDASKSQQACI